VLALPSIEEWRLYRVQEALGDGVAPCDYIEVAIVSDVARLEHDLRSEQAAELTSQLAEFCEPPTFLLSTQVA
jgi:hypothetical protein